MTIKELIFGKQIPDPPDTRAIKVDRVEPWPLPPERSQQIDVFLTASGIGSKIKIDGVEIRDVTKIVITAEVKHPTMIEVTRWALDGVRIRGEVGEVIEKPSNPEEPLMSDEFAR